MNDTINEDYQNTLKNYLKKLAEGVDLSVSEAKNAFEIVMSGEGNPAQIASLLTALHIKGEVIDEIAGAATIMRQKLIPITPPKGAMDIVGTGGDMLGTLNVSTAVAFVVAGCGVPVAKHGNRAVTSLAGTADVQGALGINVSAPVALVQRALDECGICFMFAPMHHTAMKNVVPIRALLGHKTIFNILGPLTNPALVQFALIGAYSKRWLRPMAEAAMQMGMKRAWYCHGQDGIDEISISGITHIVEIDNGVILEREIHPNSAQIPTHPLSAIKGGSAQYNADQIRALLNGQLGAFRDVVVLNAAAALMIHGTARDWQEGVERAKESIDGKHALNTLAKLINIVKG